MPEKIDLRTRDATLSSSGRGAPRPPRDAAAHASRDALVRALDSTIAAPAGVTPATSSDRLARLAAGLPSIAPGVYEVGKEVAKGGIGRVLLARDLRLDRPVAIKELLVWNPAQEQRFVREALLTARLQHPSIVPIYEAGRWPDGEPFYAMKLVSGRTLSELIEESKTLAERLSLLPHVISVAQAVAYAHSQKIIHRDLKPANVLVGEFGETVVIDWGLAKGILEEDVAPASTDSVISGDGLTVDGAIVGTPAYMPPEQAAGKAVDERADVYALGAMLYQLIAAVPPYHDALPHRLLQTIAREPPRPLDELEPAINNELCAIVQKAMARHGAHRYRTAKELADDLHRFQTGQIVAAHTYSTAQLFKRFWRRHRAALSIAIFAATIVALVLIGAFVRTNEQRMIAEAKGEEARAAEEAAKVARAAAEEAGAQALSRADELTLRQAESVVERDPNEALAWLLTLSPSFQDAGRMRMIAADAHSQGLSHALRGHTATVNTIRLLPDGRHLLSSSDDRTLRLWDLDTGESKVFTGHTDEAWDIGLLPDGQRAVSVSKDSTARIWEIATGKEVARARVPVPAEQVQARADGAIVGSSKWAGPPWIWRPDEPEVTALSSPGEKVFSSAFSLDGKKLVIQHADGMAFLVDVDTAARRPLSGRPLPLGMWRLSADGHVAVGQGKGLLVVQDLDRGTSLKLDNAGIGSLAALSRRGDLVATATSESISVYDTATGALLHRLPGHGSPLSELAFSEDSRRLATGGYDRTVRVWNLTTGASQRYAGFRKYITRIQYLPHSGSVIAASADGDIRVFDPKRAGTVLTDHASPAAAVAVSEHDRVASIDIEGHLRITQLDGTPVAEHAVPAIPDVRLFSSKDRHRFAAASLYGRDYQSAMDDQPERRTILLGTFDDAKPETLTLPAAIRSAAWRPDGGALYAALADGSVQAIDPSSAMVELDRLPELVYRVAVSENGGLVAEGGQDGLVRLTNMATMTHTDLGRHSSRVLALEFSKDGRFLASGSYDHTVKLWRLEDGSVRSFEVGGGGVLGLAFSEDSETLYFHSYVEPQLYRVDIQSGEPLPSFSDHRGEMLGFTLSDDSRRILTYASDQTARLLDAATGKGRTLEGYRGLVVDAAFAFGGRLIVTAGTDGTVRAWPDDLPETVPELRRWIEAATPDRIEAR